MGKAILIVLTNVASIPPTANPPTPHSDDMLPIRTGFDIKEAALAYHHFHHTLGLEINLASPAGGPVPIDPASLKASEHEEEVRHFLTNECAMNWLKCTDRLGHFDMERFQGVVLVGGAGALYDFGGEGMRKVLGEIEGRNGVIASIGHGAAGLLVSDVIKGKKITANTLEEDKEMKLEKMIPFSIEKKLKSMGGKFEKKEKFSSNVVEDGNLITAQNRNSTRDWLQKISEKLQK